MPPRHQARAPSSPNQPQSSGRKQRGPRPKLSRKDRNAAKGQQSQGVAGATPQPTTPPGAKDQRDTQRPRAAKATQPN
eukprot:10611276-Alexandrium_andersonii.AAC.1